MTENTVPSGSNDLPGIATIAVPSPQPGKASDHELTGRLSRAGFAKILWDAMQEVALEQRSRLADDWCEQLMRVAKLRRINWFPSLASASTPVALPTAAVQAALEEVLDATPSPHRRAKQESADARTTNDTAVAAGLKAAKVRHPQSPTGREVTTPSRPVVSTAAPVGGRIAASAAGGTPARSQTAAAPGTPDPGAAASRGWKRLA